ncbi:MAG TPA: DNRLRE domain-containing protein [Promineifilum sp.]|nr:DNRLRE domain-containing protein [Promineifilum sp.]
MKRYMWLLIGVLLALLMVLAGGRQATSARAAGNGMVEKIVFSSTRLGSQQDIYVMNPDGSNQTRLTTASAHDVDPAWSPDGTKIAFASRRNQYQYDIYVMNPDGSGQTRLTTDLGRDEMDPAWSPDGTQIAFVNDNDGITIMNADGSGSMPLTAEDDENPSWSPDGAKIAFCRGGDIMVMGVDGNNLTNLTNNPSVDCYPEWSPDGTKIVYVRYLADGAEIFVMNADGSGQTRLTNNPGGDFAPAWSPDGTKIVFNSWNSDIGGYIAMMDADGGNKTVVSTYNDMVDYSPDWGVVQGEAWPKTFLPTDDAYVVQSKPNRSFGHLKWLRIKHTKTDINSYLKFRIGSPDSVAEATLHLYVTDPAPATAVYAVSPYYRDTTTAWRERALTWANAPVIGGAPEGFLYPVKKGRWVEVDVTDAVRAAVSAGHNEVSFALADGSKNLIALAAKDDARFPPRLVIEH